MEYKVSSDLDLSPCARVGEAVPHCIVGPAADLRSCSVEADVGPLAAMLGLLRRRQERELAEACLFSWHRSASRSRRDGALHDLHEENAKLKLQLNNVLNFVSEKL
mmetsp:Transcript_105655/g.268405  ORF Transcript_105655/g.268405 Transcript_105655/m.268405 type:complete len:106 (+) Transcript_105655:51-368(+)